MNIVINIQLDGQYYSSHMNSKGENNKITGYSRVGTIRIERSGPLFARAVRVTEWKKQYPGNSYLLHPFLSTIVRILFKFFMGLSTHRSVVIYSTRVVIQRSFFIYMHSIFSYLFVLPLSDIEWKHTATPSNVYSIFMRFIIYSCS